MLLIKLGFIYNPMYEAKFATNCLTNNAISYHLAHKTADMRLQCLQKLGNIETTANADLSDIIIDIRVYLAYFDVKMLSKRTSEQSLNRL